MRWLSLYLSKHLSRGRLPLLKASAPPGAAAIKIERSWYRNEPEDVEECLYWMGRASDHEAGCWSLGGRRGQSSKASRCAGIIAHEVSVLMAKQLADQEKKNRGT